MLDVLEIVILTCLHVLKKAVLFLSPDVLGYFIIFDRISLLSNMIINACALHWCLIEFQQALSETMEKILLERNLPSYSLIRNILFSSLEFQAIRFRKKH